MSDSERSVNPDDTTDETLLDKLAAAFTGLSEAASAIDPAQLIDAWCERFGDEPLRLADFVA
jgi:hypothetical protein